MSETEERPRYCKPGQTWVCAACGRTSTGDRYEMGDTSCVTWANLCHTSSIVRDDDGNVTFAKAVGGAK